MISLGKTETFTPPWREAEEGAPIYTIRVGSVLEREMLEAELAGEHRAGRVFDFHLKAAFIAGVTALLGDDPGHEELIAIAEREGDSDDLSPPERQQLTEVRAILAEHWPEYRELVAQAARRQTLIPLLAFRRFCAGWENVAADGVRVDFAKGPDGRASLAAMTVIPTLELKTAGLFAYRLLSPAGELGNFARPSSSEGARKTSNSDGKSKAAGKSTGSAGRKTPSSRSRRGSGAS